ncbi:MAG TPA: HicB family protein, partial [Mitsuokella multacida]|nr:HicB family protein [Mitsuokella multacida]
MSHRFFYPAIFDPEDIGFSVYIPDTPGCMTQGDTMEEAMHMAQDASQLPATE